MAKAGRGQTRRDSKRRVLRPGESVRADGKYQYKYHIDGKPHFVQFHSYHSRSAATSLSDGDGR